MWPRGWEKLQVLILQLCRSAQDYEPETVSLTLDLRTKKYPVPLARHTSLQRSLGETPAYLGTHSTPSPEPKDIWEDISLWAKHCSSRKDRPVGWTEKERQRETQGLDSMLAHLA